MEHEIHITLRFHLATGKATLNEIVYKLKELRNPMMLAILENILKAYDDLICERLSHSCPSSVRKGLGRHYVKSESNSDGPCRGRRVRKRGYPEAQMSVTTA